MHYKIEQARDYLRAELFGRETAEDTHEFLSAVSAKVQESGLTRVLIWVRNSRPVFRIEKHRIFEFFKLVASNTAYRVALLGDSEELRASQEYIEVLARQQRAKVRAFREEALALEWLRTSSP
jgi:hypothetical protein